MAEMILVLFPVYVIYLSSSMSLSETPRIAVIGGGIGGTSCAYFIRLLFGDSSLIDLYEANEIGGRLSVATLGEKKYDVGGCVIHSRNRYMSDFLKLFKLKKRERSSDSYFGLYNGKDFVFEESRWQIITLFRLFKKYHIGLWRLRNHINHMLDKFEKIYKYQDNGVTFNNVTSMLAAMDPKFIDYLHISTKQGFDKEGVSQKIVDELVKATIRTNYGQDLDVHKFVGSVSVAGGSGGLWAFHNGNTQVPELLLQLSKAHLIPNAVISVRRLSSNKMEITTHTEHDNTEKDRIYDIVIIAAPQTADMKHKIYFDNFSKEIIFRGRYHQTVCTLVKGTLRNQYFKDKKNFIDAILSVNDSLFFNSISRIIPIDYEKKNSEKSDVWKIFSQRPLHENELNALFTDINDKYVKVWRAYPEYDTSERDDTFILDSNLYHINAVEWAASSIEMSVIGAKNVALLAYQNWLAREGKDSSGQREKSSSDYSKKCEL